MALSTEVHSTFQFLQQENMRLNNENEHLQNEIVRLRLILRNLGSLQHTIARISAKTDVMELLNLIMKSALESIGADDGSLLLQDDETNELVFVIVHGAVRAKLLGHRIPVGEGIAGWVAQYRQPVIVPNAQLDQRFSPRIDKAFNFKTRSVMCVPIIHDTEMKGVIQVLNKSNRKEFNDTDLMILNLVAQLAGNAISRAELFLEDQA